MPGTNFWSCRRNKIFTGVSPQPITTKESQPRGNLQILLHPFITSNTRRTMGPGSLFFEDTDSWSKTVQNYHPPLTRTAAHRTWFTYFLLGFLPASFLIWVHLPQNDLVRLDVAVNGDPVRPKPLDSDHSMSFNTSTSSSMLCLISQHQLFFAEGQPLCTPCPAPRLQYNKNSWVKNSTEEGILPVSGEDNYPY
jgi:hypothetical protein